ncbi:MULTISPECIES: hypothetical protein [Rhodobacterales]|uniref:hypothetical protein n=1 Tax=Rhodobacterales TaxID=204455 RepID=UPI0012FF9129|nr:MULTISPECIES: hypothetical protein [Rhodobacterales]
MAVSFLIQPRLESKKTWFAFCRAWNVDFIPPNMAQVPDHGFRLTLLHCQIPNKRAVIHRHAASANEMRQFLYFHRSFLALIKSIVQMFDGKAAGDEASALPSLGSRIASNFIRRASWCGDCERHIQS